MGQGTGRLLILWCLVLTAGVVIAFYAFHQGPSGNPGAQGNPATRLPAAAAKAPPLPAITLPARVEIDLTNSLRAAVKADTRGELVRWYCESPLEVVPTGARDCLVFCARPGSYRLFAWTSAAGVLSDMASTTVVVAGPEPAPEAEPKPRPAIKVEKPEKKEKKPPRDLKLWLLVITDRDKDPAWARAVAGDGAFWKEMEKDGHRWAVVDATDKETLAKNHYDDMLKEAGGTPALLILDQGGDPPNQPVRAVPLPRTVADIRMLLKKLGEG